VGQDVDVGHVVAALEHSQGANHTRRIERSTSPLPTCKSSNRCTMRLYNQGSSLTGTLVALLHSCSGLHVACCCSVAKKHMRHLHHLHSLRMQHAVCEPSNSHSIAQHRDSL
jgi:hypothetical protein